MFTSTQTTASYLPSHVFYIDAIGISYNMSKQNQYSSTMKFDTTYTEYVNPNSHNDLNDHVLNASLAVYFLFTIPNYNSNSTIITKLHIAGYYKNVVTSGKLYLFNQRYKIYDAFDLTYFPYAGTPMSKDAEYDFKNGSTFPDINPRIYINNNTGAFSLKIEAQGNTFFEFVLNYMALESYVMVDNSTTVIIVILVLSFIAAIILVKIVQRGGGFRNIRKRVQRRSSKGSRGR